MKALLNKILVYLNFIFAGALLLAYWSNYVSPARFWLLAFFGLAYPFVLLINIVFILVWWWRRKKMAFLSLIVILAGWGNIGKYLQIPSRDKVQGNDKIHLLSYNIRLFNFYEWEKGTSLGDSILGFIKAENPEIACFQEFITRESYEKISEDYIDSLLALWPFKHVSYTSSSKSYGNYGLATYSKLPIAGTGKVRFEGSFNSCIYTDVVAGQDTIRVFNVHLQSVRLRKDNYIVMDSLQGGISQKHIDEMKDISGRLKQAYIIRARQVEKLDGYIRKSPYPVILCGDFNDTPVSYTYHTLKGDLRDAFIHSGRGIGNTYRGNFPSFRIDYIFHSKDLKCIGFKKTKEEYSDHFSITAIIH